MNQKNTFTIIGSLLLLQGTGIFIMSSTIAKDSFPTLAAEGIWAASEMATVVAVLLIGFGAITLATRENAAVVPAYAIAFGVLALNTARHLFFAGVEVPVPLFALQVVFFLAIVYLLISRSKSQPSKS